MNGHHVKLYCVDLLSYPIQHGSVLHLWNSKNKSDILYLKTSRAFDVLIHSGKPNSQLVSDSVGTTSI